MDTIFSQSIELDYEILETITYNQRINTLIYSTKPNQANIIDYNIFSELKDTCKKMKDLIYKLDEERRVSLIINIIKES